MSALRTLRRAHDRLVICAETSEDWALVREMDAAIEQVAVMQASADVSLAELIEAARNVTRGRHNHRAFDSPDGGESCGLCGHNWRNTGWHFAVGESSATDEARLDAVLDRIGGAA